MFTLEMDRYGCSHLFQISQVQLEAKKIIIYTMTRYMVELFFKTEEDSKNKYKMLCDMINNGRRIIHYNQLWKGSNGDREI